MPHIGRAIAFSSRAELFVEMRANAALGRAAWHSERKGRAEQEMRPFKRKRAQRYSPLWKKRAVSPFLSDRVQRVMAVKDPLHGIQDESDLIQEIQDIQVQITERKRDNWSFRGYKGSKVLTVITAPLNPAPVGTLPAGLLPFKEIYLEAMGTLVAFCHQQGLVRMKKNPELPYAYDC